MTSIVGVVGSVAFTLITRAVYGSTEHELRNFYGAMSRYAGVLSVDPMTQVAIYQQEQTALIHQIFKERLLHAGGSQPLPGSDEYGLTSFTQKVGEQGTNATTSAFQGSGAARHGQPAGGNSPGLCRVQHQ